MKFLVVPDPQTHGQFANDAEVLMVSVYSFTEPDLRKGISNDDAHKMFAENGEMPGTEQILFPERMRHGTG